MGNNSEPDDEPEFEFDQDGEPWPLAVLWERDQADVHPGFRDALEKLVTDGCQRHRIIYLLMRIPVADALRTASKDDIATTLTDLKRAEKALQRLRVKQLLPLLGPLERQYWVVMRWLQQVRVEVKRLQQAAHGGKSLLVERLKAALVSHVIDATGALHNRQVTVLLDAAGAELWKFDDQGQFTRCAHRQPKPYDGDTHRKWRGRHADLIEEDSPFRQEWFREADAEGRDVAEYLRRTLASPARRTEARWLRAQGTRMTEIAEQLDTTEDVVEKWLQD